VKRSKRMVRIVWVTAAAAVIAAVIAIWWVRAHATRLVLTVSDVSTSPVPQTPPALWDLRRRLLLASPEYDVGSPRWSPAGDHLAYAVQIPWFLRGSWHITPETGLWVCRGDGSRPKRVTSAPGWPIAWSPDGRLLAYRAPAKMGGYDLWVCRSDGKAARRVAPGPIEGVCFSPDSRELAYVGDKTRPHVNVIALGPNGSRRMVGGGGRDLIWVDGHLLLLVTEYVERSWLDRSPWLRRLLHRQPRGSLWAERLISVDPATGQQTVVETLEVGSHPRQHSMTAPDSGGTFFLLTAIGDGRREPTAEVCAITDGGLQRVPLRGYVGYGSAEWSPDGRHVEYFSRAGPRLVEVTLKRVRRR
jgi:dipeptidyl aminopeptidase/acylaminoacyl peptidase